MIVRSNSSEFESIALRAERERKNRLSRINFLPAELFGETAWDILLFLCAQLDQNEAVPVLVVLDKTTKFQSTGRRWLDLLRHKGFVKAEGEGNAQTIALTDYGQLAMCNYLSHIVDPNC